MNMVTIKNLSKKYTEEKQEENQKDTQKNF